MNFIPRNSIAILDPTHGPIIGRIGKTPKSSTPSFCANGDDLGSRWELDTSRRVYAPKFFGHRHVG